MPGQDIGQLSNAYDLHRLALMLGYQTHRESPGQLAVEVHPIFDGLEVANRTTPGIVADSVAVACCHIQQLHEE
jgi:hypothetical protein